MKLLSAPDVYGPQEDSFLMETLVRRLAFGSVLEIGVGSGILSIAAASSENVSSVLACDINEKALLLAKKNAKLNNAKIRFVHSDLFSKIKKKFDFIIFNPPYLPEDRRCPDDLLEKALSGGRKGHETLERFFLFLSEHLNQSGKALVVFSSLTGKEKIDSIISDCLFEKEEVASEKLGFEELHSYLVSKSSLLKKIESKKIHSLKKLAKGWRGIVYSGILGRKRIAVKIENPDSTAAGRIQNEEIMLALVNKKNIGPKLLISENNFFADEFVDGERILVYLSRCSEKEALSVLSEVLRQCFILDKDGISKEEMHHPIKHVIVSKNKPVMIDFERAHFAANPSNVTQFCQFICSEPVFSPLVKKGIKFDRQVLLGLCRDYKGNYSADSFKRIVRLIKSGQAD
jgi:release factor glutamine methyltransferase